MKITERDKMLLVVLVIVLVVALAFVMPTFGVMDCRSQIEDVETKIAEVNEKMSAELAELRQMGITSSEDAKNVRQASDHLDKKIHDEKVEAARLADIVMPYVQDYNVEVGWLNSVRYIGNVDARDQDIYDIISYDDETETGKDFDNSTGTIVIGETEYSIQYTKRVINYQDTEESHITYSLEYAFEDMNEERFGALMLYLQQTASKGSICVTKATYDAMQRIGVVEVDLIMTANSDLLNYAIELEEEAAAENNEEE